MYSALIIKALLVSSNQFLEIHCLNADTSSCTPVKRFDDCFLEEQSAPCEALCYLRGGEYRAWVCVHAIEGWQCSDSKEQRGKIKGV